VSTNKEARHSRDPREGMDAAEEGTAAARGGGERGDGEGSEGAEGDPPALNPLLCSGRDQRLLLRGVVVSALCCVVEIYAMLATPTEKFHAT